MKHSVQLSDGHLGVRESDDVTQAIDAQAHLIQRLADECHGEIDVIIAGDLIAGPCQRGDADDPRAHLYPVDWEDILIEQAPPLFNVLRWNQLPVTYILGNSEGREDVDPSILERRFGPGINWTQHTGRHSFYDPESRLVVTHTNLAEPPLPLIKQCALPELTGAVSRRVRNVLYGRVRTTEAWQEHIAAVSACLKQSLDATDDQTDIDRIATAIDDEHKNSCLENARMDKFLRYLPGLSALKNALAFRTLEGMYTRTLAQLDELPQDAEMITGGHTHMPYVYNREQLVRMVRGRDPSGNLQYVTNSGTMVPLTADHGGDHRAHLLYVAGREPRLWQVYDAKKPTMEPKLVNVAGQKLS